MKKVWTCLFLGCMLVGVAHAQQNYKITQTMTMSMGGGQKSQTTIYVKGSRKRTEGGGFMGMGADVATIEQCDLKRNVELNDKKKLYFVEPFEAVAELSSFQGSETNVKVSYSLAIAGGVVTYVSSVNDTGERKQMFGLTARHIKTSMSMESSPDACMKQNMKTETDGWYIDLPEFSCPMTRPQTPPQMPTDRSQPTCRDQIKYRTSGAGKLGFALTETQTMNGGEMSFTRTVETLDFSKATLDAALFDVPAGYALAKSSQDLYGKPDYTAMAKQMAGNDDDDEDKPKSKPSKNNPMPAMNNTAPQTKRAGTIRIGVYAPTNKNGDDVSITNLQGYLVQRLTSGNVEAVAISSESDARSANCDYVLNSDFSKLKQSTGSKIGGMFGKITNTDTSAAKNYDTQVDFKLAPLSGGQTVQSKGISKGQSDVDKSAEEALGQEVDMILSKIGR